MRRIDHGHHRVEVHEGVAVGELDGNHRGRLIGGEQGLATASTAIGVVRSPMPIRTAPWPMTWTSPPSIVAGW